MQTVRSYRSPVRVGTLAILLSASLGTPGLAGAQPSYPSKFTPHIVEHPAVRRALGWLDRNFDQQVSEWIRITEIPAPSGNEHARASYVAAELTKAGFETSVDSIGNVTGRRRGMGGGPTVVFAAHLDTVHPLDTDVTVCRDGNILRAPGVSDNSNGVANMLAVARALQAASIPTRGDIILVGTAQEEVGLKGMHFWLENNPGVADMVIAVDGGMDAVSYGALGIYWTRYLFRAEGAHTLRSAGRPHPARALSEAIRSIYEIEIPGDQGGAVYNVGMVDGGSVFNALPSEVSFTVDLRSVNPQLLDSLDREIEARVARAADLAGVQWAKEVASRGAAGGTEEMLQDRRSHPLVQTALDVKAYFGYQPRAVASGSTDANAAVTRGIPAVTVGKGRGGDAHSLAEWAEIDGALPATKMWLLLALSLAELG